MTATNLPNPSEGVLLVNKPKGRSSFTLVGDLRRLTGIRKIGHAGTLDPFATGVMILLIGKTFTRLSDQFLGQDKEYVAELKLGATTDTYDCEGLIGTTSDHIPSLSDVEQAITYFQGEIDQVPPMYSAKKVNGKKLYELARKGVEVERKAVKVVVETTLLSYDYPFVRLQIKCSKGTYIRSIGHEIGQRLGCGGHLTALERVRSGRYQLDQCLDGSLLRSPEFRVEMLQPFLQKQLDPCG